MNIRIKSRGCLQAIICILFISGEAGFSNDPSSGLTVTHRARSLQPGEVVLVTLESAKPLRNASGYLLGREFPFYTSPGSRVWRGLVGIDLEARPGNQFLEMRGSRSDGSEFRVTHNLRILSKAFPTRRLTVDEQFVTPPKEVEERIHRESQRMDEIFKTTTSVKMWRGPFAAPVPGPASSSFGRRSILNGKPRSPHTGTDFSADTGTVIQAPNAGRAVLVADLYFSGNTVIIDHGQGLYSLFAHLSKFSVHEGEEIKIRQTIGRVGATGRVTGPHLHWAVRLVGTHVDPQSLMEVLNPPPRTKGKYD